MHGGTKEMRARAKGCRRFLCASVHVRYSVDVPLTHNSAGRIILRAEYAVNGGCRDLFADKNIAFYTL